MKILLILYICFSLSAQLSAQNIETLRQNIEKITKTKKAKVGVAIYNINTKQGFFINEGTHFPLQSVYKFHIALVVLSLIDEGKFTLDKKISITKKDLVPNLYSPIKETYPNGVTLTVAEILEYTVCQSDNVGCDVLLRLIGGPSVVENYFIKNKFTGISIKTNEQDQQAYWQTQFKNWITVESSNDILKKFFDKKQPYLSKNSYKFIWGLMEKTQTGKERLKGKLPTNVVVAHKTGTSGKNKDRITSAVNDIGIIYLPNGDFIIISVFVTNSIENDKTNEKIIADISKTTYDFFIAK